MAALADRPLDDVLAATWRAFSRDAALDSVEPPFAAAIVGPGGTQLAGLSNAPLLAELAACTSGYLHRRHPAQRWSPHDVFVSNDPFRGGVSPRVVSVLAPVPLPGRPGALVALSVRHTDVGAMADGAFAMKREARHEGFLLSLLKVDATGGRLPPLLCSMLAANVRQPAETMRWLDAQLAATLAAVHAIAGGLADDVAFAALEARARADARGAVGALARGSYRGRATVDAAGTGGLGVDVEVVVRDGRLTVRTAAEPEPDRPSDLHAPAAGTRAGVIAAAAFATGVPGWAVREAIDVDLGPGPVFDAAYPAAVGRGEWVALAVHAATCDALGAARGRPVTPLDLGTFTGSAR